MRRIVMDKMDQFSKKRKFLSLGMQIGDYWGLDSVTRITGRNNKIRKMLKKDGLLIKWVIIVRLWDILID
jgi:hypothetical protein